MVNRVFTQKGEDTERLRDIIKGHGELQVPGAFRNHLWHCGRAIRIQFC